MDLLKDDTKQLYRKYLIASLASAVVMSIYSMVDTIAIGMIEFTFLIFASFQYFDAHEWHIQCIKKPEQ